MKKDPLKEIKIIVLINPHQRSPADMRPPLQEPPWTQPSPGRLTKWFFTIFWVVTCTYCKTLKVRARTVVPPCPSPWRRAASVSRPAHHHPKPSQPQSQSSSFFFFQSSTLQISSAILISIHRLSSSSSSSYGRNRFTTSRFYWCCHILWFLRVNDGKPPKGEICLNAPQDWIQFLVDTEIYFYSYTFNDLVNKRRVTGKKRKKCGLLPSRGGLRG